MVTNLPSSEEVKAVAKTVFQQTQKVKFINKKVGAVGTALVATNESLNSLVGHDKALAKVLWDIAMNQQSITNTTVDLVSKWDGVNQAQTEEAKSIQATQEQLLALYGVYDTYVNAIKAQQAEKVTQHHEQLQAFANTYKGLLEALNEVTLVEELAEIRIAVNKLQKDIIDVKASRLVENRATDKRLEKMTTFVVAVAKLAEGQKRSIEVLEAHAHDFANRVDSIDKKITLITPEAYKLSDDDIMAMFAVGTDGEEPVEDSVEEFVEDVVEETNVQVIELPSEEHVDKTQNKEPEKRKFWEFWK